ncbi:MAG: DUF1295 domain-containing protein [Acidobacteriota bacterium]
MTFLLLAGLATVMATMFVVWIISVKIGNAGIVDVAWSALFAILAAIYAVFGHGDPQRRIIASLLMILWSLRLALHLGRRVLGHIETEDARYAELRKSWGAKADRRMLAFFLFQGITNVVLSVPIALVAVNPRPGLGILEWLGIALWVVALAGESIADAQLHRFKQDMANGGAVCDVGLWRYSRHPNYFFEWLVWCAYFLFALGSPWGWISFYCPLLMLWFLYKVTGIPATEAHSLQTRGEAYRQYQQRTSAFVPWFPKKSEVSR